MSETRAISTTWRRKLSSGFFYAMQDAEGNTRHSDRNISLFPSWSGQELISTPVHTTLKLNSFSFNPLNAELNPTCHLLALLGTHHILHVSRIRVKKNKL